MVLRIVSGWFEGLEGDGLKDCEYMVCRVGRGWFEGLGGDGYI